MLLLSASREGGLGADAWSLKRSCPGGYRVFWHLKQGKQHDEKHKGLPKLLSY